MIIPFIAAAIVFVSAYWGGLIGAIVAAVITFLSVNALTAVSSWLAS